MRETVGVKQLTNKLLTWLDHQDSLDYEFIKYVVISDNREQCLEGCTKVIWSF